MVPTTSDSSLKGALHYRSRLLKLFSLDDLYAVAPALAVFRAGQVVYRCAAAPEPEVFRAGRVAVYRCAAFDRCQ